jgi:tetratricopeptide (TPR) repeat protein
MSSAKILPFPLRNPVPGKRNFPEPCDADALFKRALEAQDRKDLEQAILLYQKILELDPRMAGAAINLGVIYWHQKKLALAEEYFLRALATDHRYGLAWYNLAQCSEKRGCEDEAMSRYRTCVTVSPFYTDAQYNLALLCARHGLASEALGCYRFFLEHAPADDPHRNSAALAAAILAQNDIHAVSALRWEPKPLKPRSRSARRRQARERTS